MPPTLALGDHGRRTTRLKLFLPELNRPLPFLEELVCISVIKRGLPDGR